MFQNIKYYIIGPTDDWSITRRTFYIFSISISTIFLLLIFASLFQFFRFQYTSGILNKNLQNQQVKADNLQSTLKQLREKVENKSEQLSQLGNIQNQQKNEKIISQKDVDEYKIKIKEYKIKLEKQNAKIQTLDQQQKKYENMIKNLNRQLKTLEQNLQ